MLPYLWTGSIPDTMRHKLPHYQTKFEIFEFSNLLLPQSRRVQFLNSRAYSHCQRTMLQIRRVLSAGPREPHPRHAPRKVSGVSPQPPPPHELAIHSRATDRRRHHPAYYARTAARPSLSSRCPTRSASVHATCRAWPLHQSTVPSHSPGSANSKRLGAC